MRIFHGTVCGGYGIAARNLAPVMGLIEERTGLANLVQGTLNLTILEEYIVRADALLLPDEYPYNRESNLGETIKFQRCLVAGHKGLIMRPDTHETGQFHGPCHLEVMGQKSFREALSLTDGSVIEVQVEGDEEWWRSGI
jgi:CTP-dependent riboflavin kinase